MDHIRKTGKKALSTVIKEKKNLDIFENRIYLQSGDKEELYKRYIYQVIGLLLQNKNDIKRILKDIKKGNIGWNSREYSVIANKIEEHDIYLEKPFEISSGVVECGSCGSDKVYSFASQKRSGDEATSTVCRCSQCGKSWVQNG
jgi:DNA-directed RNA polymerase subunit M/transcription elongation factor TFIIS